VAWLSFNYLIVRIGLFWMNAHIQGTCLGSLTDPLQIARGIPGLLAQLMPVFLLIGSGTLLFRSWRAASQERKSKPNTIGQQEMAEQCKMTCPSCGGHIAFSRQNDGQAIPCPHCKASITLRRERSLKMSCTACQGHIVFPAHALGRSLQCPHCRVDITLKEPATP
jgi:DNA-directed RNA polymerase subunit M/transcription elongation factor TFIIS